MKTIKIFQTAFLAITLSLTVPAFASSFTNDTTVSLSPTKSTDPKTEQLVSRLNEIKAMDKTEMSKSEKKEIRKEVRGIKKEMKTLNQGVYLSVGAIIIIILLLILIL